MIKRALPAAIAIALGNMTVVAQEFDTAPLSSPLAANTSQIE